MLDIRMCGGVEIETDERLLSDALVGGRQGRLVFAYLVCERDRAVRREELAELLWPEQLPESWTASLSAVISRLRRLFAEAGFDGAEVVTSTLGAYQLHLPTGSRVDLDRLVASVTHAEDAAAAGDGDRALAAAAEAETIAARGFLADDCAWVDAKRDTIRDLRVRAAIAQSIAYLAAGSASRAIETARRAVDLDPSKESAYRQLMRALVAAGERGEALRVWERCRIALVEELGVDPSPETEAVYLEILGEVSAAPVTAALPSGVVTFLLTDIVESSSLWEENPAAMAVALERHDAIVASIVENHEGTLLKSKLEGDATVSVFARATAATSAALALLDALAAEPWPDAAAPRLRMAMHTGEAFERGGDYFGPALNRAARLRSLAGPSEVLLSQAVAELVRDHLPDGVALRDLGHRNLRGLSRGENVFQLMQAVPGAVQLEQHAPPADLARPPVPSVLAGSGPFVGRQDELAELIRLWDDAESGRPRAIFIGGEPGVGKSRLAGEIARHAYAAGGLVLYGRCDEDLAAPLQPFIEAVRSLAPALGAARLRAVRGVDELTRVAPEFTELLGDEAPAVRADPDTERLALFDAVTQLLGTASREAPMLLVLDDLHWAGKTTLSLLRHVLRGAKNDRILVVGTYRDTELARTHPLAATLVDLRRDAETHRIGLGGLAAADVDAYFAAIGNTDRALGRELAEITSGNPFFLIEALRHVEETGGTWEPGNLPEGVREATGRRLSRLSDAANDALTVAAVVGITFDLALVEQVRGADLVDPIAEACQAGLVVEEPGSLARFRFAHALVRQVLLAELVTLKRVRLHRTIAELLEAAPSTGDPDARLADLAYHWYECASAGSADHAVAACRRAADRAMERLAYEEAGDLYGMALQALDAGDADDGDSRAALHLAQCDALLTAGDVAGARTAIDALELAATGSERLAAWYTTYEGLLAVLAEPDRLTEIVQSIGAAADAMRAVGDQTGEAKAHYVHATALERLGQIGAAARALDAALAAARGAGNRRLADAILAEAPPAALWGPRSVTRASGDCLDVVRVLRISAGAPAVEAVALRCQAVLEALRGRTDAARRMIRSAHRTVEQLGLTHRRLETEVMAGFIELLAGEAAAAEEHLRVAYDELRDRGLGGEAAQAGAFLGRALLLQDRIDEADEVAAGAEVLAGSDLKAAIAWRDVRALAAARRGDTTRALALAREAVDMASATDALLLVADARLTLATVLRATGDTAAADAEAQRAVDACDTKGATVMAARARAAMSRPAPPIDAEAPHRAAAPIVAPAASNAAMAATIRMQEAFNRGDWDAVRANEAPGLTMDDRRHYVAMTIEGEGNLQLQSAARLIYEGGGRFDRPELVATRGSRLALCRCLLRGPGMEVSYLALQQVDETFRSLKYVMFEPEDMDHAIATLDELAGATRDAASIASAFENDATRATDRVHAAYNTHDWDALIANLAEDNTLDDHRSVVSSPPLDPEQSLAGARWIFDGGGTFDKSEIIATRGRTLAVTRTTLHTRAPEAIATVLIVQQVDDAGRSTRTILFDTDDVEGAIAELDALFLVGEVAVHAHTIGVISSLLGAMARRDPTAIGTHLDPEFVVRDHRPIGLPVMTKDCWLASLDDAFTLYREGELRVGHVEQVAADGGLWAVIHTGEHADGSAYEIGLLMVFGVDGDLVNSLDLFDEDNLDAARAVLVARRSPLAPSGTDRFANAAWNAALRFSEALNNRDWPAFLAALDPGYQSVDNRQGIHLHLTGDEAVETHRVIFTLDECRFERELVATRGDCLALTRDLVSFVDGQTGAAEVEVLGIVECGADGLIVANIVFGSEEIDTAYDALDARFVELGGPDFRPYRHAFDRRDWLRFARFFADDCTFEDRARVGMGRFDLGEFISRQRRMPSIAPDVVLRVDHVVASGPSASLVVGRNVGTQDGGPFEISLLTLSQLGPDRRITAMIWFDPENLDAARAEYDRITVPSLNDLFPSAAWQAAVRTGDASNRRDQEAFDSAIAPHFEFIDRRSGLGVPMPDGAKVHQFIFQLDAYRIDRELVATRDDRLALVKDHSTFRDGAVGEAEVECLTITEVDASGMIVRGTLFDIDDMTAALDELDARQVALGGNPLGARMRHAFDARDWEMFASIFTPDCTIGDYRTAGWGVVGGATFIDFQRSVVELAPDAQLWIDHDRSRGNIHMSTGRVFGNHAGGAWEIAFVTVSVEQPDGRTTLLESYELHDIMRARERFDELVEAAEDEPFANAAWRAALRFRDALNNRDWPAFVGGLDPNFLSVDNRQGIRLHLTGDDALATYHYNITLDECRVERALLATRGDRLALTRDLISFVDGQAGPAEVEVLVIVECGADGLMVAMIAFGPDEADAAHDALDARFVELGGPDLRPYRHAFDRRDWARFARFYTDDCTFEDRRPASLGLMDLDGFIARHQSISILSIAPDVVLRLDHVVASGPSASLMVARNVGTHEGGPFEIPLLSLSKLAPDGRITAIITFDIGDLDAARAAYDRITTPSLNDLIPDNAWQADQQEKPFANAAWQAEVAHAAAVNARDWDAFVASVAPNVEHDDRRSGIALVTRGDEAIATYRYLFTLDRVRLERKLIATRGDHLALGRTTATFEDGEAGPAEVVCLTVVEIDENARVTCRVLFDADDLAGAHDELDARHVALGGNPLVAVMRHAYRARDWNTFASVFTVDCRISDHRWSGWGVFDRDAFVDYHRHSVVDLASDAQVWVDHLRETGNVALTISHGVGTRDGGSWVLPVVSVSIRAADGRFRAIDIYAFEDLDRARARFDELVATDDVDEPFANAAWRMAVARGNAVNTRDWDAFAASVAPNVQHDDRRRNVELVTGGDEAMAVYRYLFTLDRVRLEHALLATRGDRLAVVRSTVTFEDGEAGPAEVVCLALFEVDESGLGTYQVLFDADDLSGAHDELDRRALVLGVLSGAMTSIAFNTRDWDAFTAQFHPDLVATDHRHGRLGPMRRDAFVDLQRVPTELAPDARVWVDHLHVEGNVALTMSHGLGTRDGGSWVLPVVSVSTRAPDGRFLTIDTYAREDLDRARARFDELVAERTQALTELEARATALAADPPTMFANEALRSLKRLERAAQHGDVDATVAEVAPGTVIEFRRSMFDHRFEGADALAWWQSVRPGTDGAGEVLATRGERLALVRATITTRENEIDVAEVERLVLAEVDGDGRRAFTAYFDIDDVDAAYAELDDRFVAQLDDATRSLWKAVVAATRSYNHGDLDAITPFHAEDVLVNDHRPLIGADVADFAGWLELSHAWRDSLPDMRARLDHVLEISPTGMLLVNTLEGQADTGAFERKHVHVIGVDESGLISRFDIYDIDDLDGARQAFAELTAGAQRGEPH